ncbi:MAG: ABC transporter ATP-binding protein [Anaerolineae bacterium]|nr:ABC transporter ATP-binding protein [Anaerolineae bacterium]
MRGHGPGRGPARIERAKDIQGTLRRLLRYLSPYRTGLVAVVVLVVISSTLALVGPVLMGRAIDNLIATRHLPGLLRISLLMLAVYLGGALTSALTGVILARISQRTMQSLRRDLFEHLQSLSLSFFDRQPHGELMSRLTNDIDAINQVLSQQIPQLISGLLTLVGIVVMMFVLNVWMALASMIVLPLMTLFVGVVGKRTRGGFRQLQQQLGTLNGQLEEIYSGQRVIIAFGQQGPTFDRFQHANEAVRDTAIRAMSYATLIPPLMGVFSNANIAVLVGIGGWLALKGLTTVGTIATFINYSRQFAAPLRQLGNLYNQVQSAIAGAERVFEILDEHPEIEDTPNAIPLDQIEGHVVLDHVDFSYVPGVRVLHDVSLEAMPGQTIALVGPTGAGKTTIVNLLTRFYDLDSGAIRIDGHDIRHVCKADLRRQLGIVLQDNFLFADSVMENIRYGRLDATDDEVIAAAKLANADQFIQRLPDGYATALTERGSNLSHGQRQLLAIARAILANPAILILDEATSSVDTRTEAHIQEALLKLMEGRTSFVIAHRLSTIREADQVLVINEGRIVERGTHDELLARRGFYYNLYMSQFRKQAVLQAPA